MKHFALKPCLTACLFCCSANAFADITWSGFANIIGGKSPGGESLYGYDDGFSFNEDSLLGLQASSSLGDGLGMTVQVISRGSDDWEPLFEWAIISYDINEDWRVLFGRQRTPANMFSDFVDVGFAYPWIQPPRGMYSPSFDSYDGIGSIYNFSLGDTDNTFHVLFGRSFDNPFGDVVDNIDIKDYAIAAWSIEWEWLTFRLSYNVSELEVDFPTVDGLADALAAGDAGLPDVDLTQLAEDMKMDGDSRSTASVGVKVQKDQLFFVAEYSDSDDGDNFLGDSSAWYTTLGWSFDEVMVYAIYGENEEEANIDIFEQLPTLNGASYIVSSGADNVYGTDDDGLDFVTPATAYAVMASRNSETSYYSLGLRWSFHDSASINFEYTEESDDLNQADDNSVLRVGISAAF